MRAKLRHLMGISGGKDSAALAIYLSRKYPTIEFEYYFCDTGKELSETYDLIDELEAFLGMKVTRLRAASKSHKKPFDHYLKNYNGYLPAANARWCTKNLKLEPFEEFVGDDPAISYVAIRGDEHREGYVSTKPNIQTIFPFRRNMWSIEILSALLSNENINSLSNIYKGFASGPKLSQLLEIVNEPKSQKMPFSRKINMLLDIDIALFNKVVFEYLKGTNYPLGILNSFPLIDNTDVIVKEDVFDLFKKNGISIPKYYTEVEFEIDGVKSNYSRSRSGCYFCFYQQKIEWVWLYEQHNDLFKKAMDYEKDGYSWNEDETLFELSHPDRIKKIKEDHIRRQESTANKKKSGRLIDILSDDSGPSCVNCLI